MVSFVLVIELIFVDPNWTIPISLTGNACFVNCSHCGGHYLAHMKTLQDLDRFAAKGYKSFLISGGLEKDLLVPFMNYLSLLRDLKGRYKLVYNFHVGFPQKRLEEIEDLADIVSFDFFTDPSVMEAVYGFSIDPFHLLKAIETTKVPAIPHITIGIFKGRISQEHQALELLSQRFNSIVLNVFVPTPATKFAGFPPPNLAEVREIFEHAREKFKFIALGCMQPKGQYRRLLQQVVKPFVDVIVKPLSKVEVNFKGCCAFLLSKISKSEVVTNVR
ncbi:MAG: radical SAM protein [Pseudothermotoga sp.]|nr:radical SAM protein [Pseudothermotoga sp.]MDW8140622.1 radical SAM protein [Pseudothermotoga sp.]